MRLGLIVAVGVWLAASGFARADVIPGPAGSDPTHRAEFRTWYEGGDEVPWHSYSRDGGATWSKPRRAPVTLALREGLTRPSEAMPAVPAIGALPPGGRLFIVQFHTVSLPEFRTALRTMGVEVLQSIPHHAHVVRFDPHLASALRSLPFVARVEPYHPWYRLESDLQAWLTTTGEPRVRELRVVAVAWGEAAKRRIAEAARAAGAAVGEVAPAGQVLRIVADRAQLASIAAHDDVSWIDRETPASTDMDLVRLDTGSGPVESNPGYCGTGVRGEVLDSRVDAAHQDFDGILLHGPNPPPFESHGTKVFGILFGNGTLDGDGNATATGMLPCAQGIAADHGSLTDRFAHTQQLLAAPYFASFQSNSWGSVPLTTSYTSKSFELDDIAWRLDLAITQSQSNSGTQLSRPEAWAKNVISVGGIRHHDTLSLGDDDFGNPPSDCPPGGCSSIGPAEDGRVKPDLAHWNDSIFTTTWVNGYANFGGTSASTPIAAGVVGLVLEMWSDNVWNTNPVGQTVFERKPHASTIKALVINSADPYPFTASSPLSRFKQGWGRPNAVRALERAATSFVLDESVLLELDEWAPVNLEVAPGEAALRVTMVYPDPPGTTSATVHRINDLDLELRSPAGLLYRGNFGLTAGPWSQPGGAANSVDTVENVFVENPEPGTWHLRVRAVEVNQDAHLASAGTDDVTFGLVATGATGLLCTAMQLDFTAVPAVATVGEPIEFTPTVIGGAPGPKTYRWDFDGDGNVDSTDPAPLYTFHEPFSGSTRLTVLDSQACPEHAAEALVVNGPRLVHHSVEGLTQVSGNGNGSLDPGETWEFDVRLLNDGNLTAAGVSAKVVAPTTNPGGVLMLQDTSTYADIAPAATGPSLQHYRFKLGHGFDCDSSVVFSVTSISSTTPLNVYPDGVGAIVLPVGGAPCAPFGSVAAGRVASLSVELDGQGDLVLDWSADCADGTGYSVYRGQLEGGYASTVAAACDHPATSIVLEPAAGGEFFFVAASGAEFDGSYGILSDGSERPPLGAGACQVLDADDCP